MRCWTRVPALLTRATSQCAMWLLTGRRHPFSPTAPKSLEGGTTLRGSLRLTGAQRIRRSGRGDRLLARLLLTVSLVSRGGVNVNQVPRFSTGVKIAVAFGA